MAVVLNKCQFPHDLGFAIKQLEADIGERLIANQKLLKDAESVLPGMDALFDEGNAILDNLLSKNGAGTSTSSSITNGEDISKQYGLLPDKSTTEQDEKFVSNAGLFLLDKIIYLSGDASDNPRDAGNISTLRRLYFAFNKDLKKVENVLNNATKTVFIHDQLFIKVLPAKGKKTGYTINEIRTLTKQDQLEESDIGYTDDKRAIVLLKNYLAQDQAKEVTKNLTKVPDYRLITNVFHLNGVDTSTNGIRRYTELGYANEEFNSILQGKDFIESNKVYATSELDKLRQKAFELITYINFVQSRLKSNNINIASLKGCFDQMYLSLGDLLSKHEGLITLLNFEVSQFLQKDILTKLREKHSDSQIVYLLERRKDINGIFFNPPDDVFLKALNKSVNASLPGTTYVSNQAINKKNTSLYDQSLLLSMYALLLDARQQVMGKTYASLEAAKKSLNAYINTNPFFVPTYATQTSATTSGDGFVLQGQPSFASVSPILTEKADIGKTMDFEKKKKNVLGSFKDLYDMYPESVAGPLSDVINSIVSIFEKVFKAIDSIISSAEKTLFAMKKRLDSWLSKHASLTGQGNFESSLLKCAVNWDIGLSTDLLDQLFNFIMKFLSQLLAFVSKIKAWIADILTKILCLPVNLLNSFLGKLSVSLPTGCRVPKFDLGTKLNDSLNALLNVSSAKSILLQSCTKDIARLKMSISAAPDRLGQFKASAFCDSPASSSFMNASNLNISAGVTL